MIPPNPVRLPVLDVVVVVVCRRNSAESARFLAGAVAPREGDSDGVRLVLVALLVVVVGLDSGTISCSTCSSRLASPTD